MSLKDKKFEDMTKEEIEKALWETFDFIPEDRRQATIDRTVIGMVQ